MKPTVADERLPSILVVDDIIENLQLLTGMLKGRGYKARPVLSGKLALQAAQNDPPDLILLDVSMPDMSGYEVCERVKQDARLKDIPIIFISALDETSDKVKAFRAGGVDYVTKPFQVEEVAARVGTHLQLKQAMEALKCEREQLHAAHEQLSRVMRGLRMDIELAARVQEAMLPASGTHAFGGILTVVARYNPENSVGGDFYDFKAIDDQHVGIILADVAGHGLHAAFVTGLIKTSFVLAGEKRLNPAGFALQLNRLLCDVTGDVSFATMVYCVYDAATRTLRYLNAGHSPFPIVILPGEDPRPISTASNPLLGILELEEMTEEAFTLPRGAILLLATDGLTDAYGPDGKRFGYARLLATVRAQSQSTPSELDQAVFDEVTRFRGSTAQTDDIATLTMQFD